MMFGAAARWKPFRPLAIGVMACAVVVVAGVVVHIINNTDQTGGQQPVSQISSKFDPEQPRPSLERQKSHEYPWNQAAHKDGRGAETTSKAKTEEGEEKKSGKLNNRENKNPATDKQGDRKTNEARNGAKDDKTRLQEGEALQRVLQAQRDLGLERASAELAKNTRALQDQAKDKPNYFGPAEKPRDADALAEDMLNFRYSNPQAKREADGKGDSVDLLKKAEDKRLSAQPFVVRQYAHGAMLRARRDSDKEKQALDQNKVFDLTETLFWSPTVILPDGQGRIEFKLNDAATTFQVEVMGHTLEGRLGATRTIVESRSATPSK
jgi:hypothetical protein